MAGHKRATALLTPKAQLSEYRRKRDFSRTKEPSGDASGSRAGTLGFVIQKHAASHLHFDLRLELDGVMKSWAVPKGPSLDPGTKRLAMQVEDHPIDYNSFEGTIPKGQYGGGTVMLWDVGTYSPDADGSDPESVVRESLRRGDLKITFDGKRLRGSFALVRMKFASDKSEKPQWLLIKHRDEFAGDDDVIAENMTSVTSGRTMEQIASGRKHVWNSNRSPAASAPGKATRASSLPKRAGAASGTAMKMPSAPLEPMYATIGTNTPGEGWTFEPKYDGIRILAFATADDVRLITRNGKDKSAQFPEIVSELKKLSRNRRRSLVLDGEIVALIGGEPARFQELQGRMHVQETSVIEDRSANDPAALILFDILTDGEEVLVREPWHVRRKTLLARLKGRTTAQLRVTESDEGDGEKMLAKARTAGWEGLIAKRLDSRYEPGSRSRSWVKLKIEFRQEFVIGGYTEPRNSREHIGALLLGYYDQKRFIYVGHTGGGFTRAALAAMYRRLAPLERKRAPFEETPRTNERAHWVKPEVVVEVKFNEWTADRRLRQPIFLGVRDDKSAGDVGLEGSSMQKRKPRAPTGGKIAKSSSSRVVRKSLPRSTRKAISKKMPGKSAAAVVDQLTSIEEKGGEGSVRIGRDGLLDVTSLGKIFFPKAKLTKGDLMRYYATVSPFILPAIADRPLVLKRYPGGITGHSFYQQNAGESVPEGVRVETITNDDGERQERFVGGDLLTLLYTVQMGSVSVDPWHSRLDTLDFPDYTIIDLDPGPRAPFSSVVKVAHLVKEVLDASKLHGAIKTSGSTGLHIYLPLPPRTPTAAATLVAQVVATRVVQANPRLATIARSVKARGPAMVYVDYLQNIKGKTIAGAYCVRAREGAVISTPIEWDELDGSLNPAGFTMTTVPPRLAAIGDIWAKAMKKKNSLRTFA